MHSPTEQSVAVIGDPRPPQPPHPLGPLPPGVDAHHPPAPPYTVTWQAPAYVRAPPSYEEVVNTLTDVQVQVPTSQEPHRVWDGVAMAAQRDKSAETRVTHS